MPLKYDVSMDVAITVEVTIEDDEQVPDDDQERYAEDKAMHYVEMGVPLSMTIGDITITDTRLVAIEGEDTEGNDIYISKERK